MKHRVPISGIVSGLHRTDLIFRPLRTLRAISGIPPLSISFFALFHPVEWSENPDLNHIVLVHVGEPGDLRLHSARITSADQSALNL
jgi:hypothetical protein